MTNIYRLQRLLLLASVLLLLQALPAFAKDRMHEIKSHDITVCYPEGLESQAKDVCETADKVITPKIAEFLSAAKTLQYDKIVDRIVTLTGCPDRRESLQKLCLGCRQLLDAEIVMAQNLKLYRESDIRKTGKLKDGIVEIDYNQDEDTFGYTISIERNARSNQKAFMPIVVRNDGSIYTNKKTLEDRLAEAIEPQGLLFVLHETAEFAVVDTSHHPYTRWFNEGTANWVMLRLTHEILPNYDQACIEACLPSDSDNSYRPKVNILAWPQNDFDSYNKTIEETAISEACYKFSTQAICKILDGQPADTLAKILGKLKRLTYTKTPDTDQICNAISEVTGKYAKSTLLEYVPDEVRNGITNGEYGSLVIRAKQKLRDKDYASGIKQLYLYLSMKPCDPEARFDLAWALRHSDAPKRDSERQIKQLVGCLSVVGAADLSPIDEDAEAYYVFGRLAQLNRNKTQAEKSFKEAIRLAPDHADAKAALAELKKK
jgi:hypothetical protein